MPDRSTCTACGHEDWATEMYNQAGPGGCYTYCRNHNSCQTRMKTLYATQRKAQTMTQFGEYIEPAKSEGDTYRPQDNFGHSVIIHALRIDEAKVTGNSPQGAPALFANVYDLNLKQAFRDVMMMTGAIVDGCRPHVGKAPIVVKWEETKAASGRPYARPVRATEAAIDAAKAVYAAGDPFAPELGTVTNAMTEESPF